MKRGIIIAVILALGLGCAFYFFRPASHNVWLGWVEADMLYLGGTSTARLTERTVDEGDSAEKGELLFTFESTSEAAAVETARANVLRAEAALDLARAPQDRPEELQALQATLSEAQATYDYAEKNLTRARDLFAKQSGTKANLDDAVSSYAQAKATLDRIDAQIALGKLPQRDQSIEEAVQSLAAAKSDLAAAEAVIDLKTIAAPETGSIQQTYYRVGEVVPAGRPVVALLPPENIKVVFFIPERQRAAIRLGDTIHFSCDGCTDQTAKVSFIAEDAEYTPPEIFSREERTKMVYRARAIPDDASNLPVGLPVSVAVPQGDAR